ncbi:hypothetical protein [Chryseobacterium taeanense]
MTFHAHQLIFEHPLTNQKIIINAKIDDEFKRVGDILNFDLSAYS